MKIVSRTFAACALGLLGACTSERPHDVIEATDAQIAQSSIKVLPLFVGERSSGKRVSLFECIQILRARPEGTCYAPDADYPVADVHDGKAYVRRDALKP